MTSVKTYSVSKKVQLIDINHDMINFKVEFVLSSSKPFYALIIDQETLDNTELQNIEFRLVEDSISGEVISNKNVYQNYYIILKSDTPTDVEVQLFTTPLPDVIEPEETQYPPQEVMDSPPETHTPPTETSSNTPSYNLYSYKNIVMYILLISLVLYILYYMMYKKKNNSETSIRKSLLDKLQQQV